MYNISETVLPIYINGQCPIIKTCSDVTLNLSSKDYTSTFDVNEVTLIPILKVCATTAAVIWFGYTMDYSQIFR